MSVLEGIQRSIMLKMAISRLKEEISIKCSR